MCKLFYFVQNLTYSCSVLILLLISLERYIAIKHPMLMRRFGRVRAVYGVLIGGAWLVSTVYSLPWLVAYEIVTTSTDTAFCINTLPQNRRVYAILNFFVLYVLPLVFMTFVYVRISVILWRSDTILSLPLITFHLIQPNNQHHQHDDAPRISSSRTFVTNSYPNSPYLSDTRRQSNCARSRLCTLDRIQMATAAAAVERQRRTAEFPPSNDTTVNSRDLAPNTIANQRRSTSAQLAEDRLTSRRKVVRLLAAIVVSFALCMLPHHLRVQWLEWRSSNKYSYVDMHIPPVTTLIFYVNSCLNPLLYALISDKFRQAFADLRCRKRAASAPAVPATPAVTPLRARRPNIRCNSYSY